MKKFLVALLLLSSFTIFAQVDFQKYFTDKTLRIDYFHIGSNLEEIFTIDKMYEYGIWAGSTKNLIDNFNNGRYYYKIYSVEDNKLIYSKGFDSYFGEYKTGDDGLAGKKRTYHESAIIPSPKAKIIFAIERRNKSNILEEIFRQEVDPASIEIIKDKITSSNVVVVKSLESGDPHKKLDIVILAEGYTRGEAVKFKNDLKRFTALFTKQEPYKSLKNNINVYGVFKPSEESGSDEPEANIFKNTVLNTTFNSLGSERYLLTEDNKTMRDLAAFVPYDAIYIMVNHSRYGGGGIYNLFCTFTADNQWFEYLFLHEFGHSFAGLGDEYYTSDVAYNEFYPKGIEPVEPNITAETNKENVKWKHFFTENTLVPTPWEKAAYDSIDLKWQAERRIMNKHVSELKKQKAPKQEIDKAIEEYDKKDREHAAVMQEYLKKSKFNNMVGVFEGSGYSSQGLYRPALDCIMFSKGFKPFCKVCEERVKQVIMFYAE